MAVSEIVIPEWDRYYLDIAQSVSARASCPRLQVGAVLVRDRYVVGMGYNGSVSEAPSCLEKGCDIEQSLDQAGDVVLHCVRTVHAEVNAVIHAAKHGASVDGATLFANYGPPCWPCFKVLANAGVEDFIFDHGYRPDPRVMQMASDLGLQLFIWNEAHGEFEDFYGVD